MNNNKNDIHNDKYILDACCGSRMFWFDKSNKNTVFMDNRVLEDCGVLIFKWNDDQIKFGEILKVIDYKPLFGDKRGKTRWTVFMKEKENE